MVGSTPACCPPTATCSNQISGCTDPSLVECPGYDFCCPAGQTCYRDAVGNAQCGGVAISPPPDSGSSATPHGSAGYIPHAINSAISSDTDAVVNTAVNTGGINSAINSVVNSFLNGGNASPTSTTSSSGGGLFHHNAAGQFIAPVAAMGLIVTLTGAMIL